MAHVLVIEDDAATRLLIETVLRRHKLDCTGVDNGASAVEMLRRTRFDAVVLDLLLPKVSGFEVLREMQRSTPDLLPRVVICTALPEAQLRDREELRNVGGLLLKPSDIGGVAGAVLRVVALESQPSTRSDSSFWFA